MVPVKPMLDDIELQQVQEIQTDAEQVRAQHAVPALEGDFLQPLGRRASRISLGGLLTGPQAGEGLQKLREKFRTAAPVPFVADIATATQVEQVLIEAMSVRELAGLPSRFEYAFTLREYLPPPEPEVEPPPPEPPPPPPVDTGTLIVEVIVEGDPNFDFSTVTVTVEGTQEDGSALSRGLANRTGNLWTEEDFPPGRYTARAVVSQPEPMSGQAAATVRRGQTTQVTITLRPGQTGAIAKAFIVHFWFDKAFIEPCLRQVLKDVADYASAHPDEKLVIVGHTDLTGSDAYNQALSERRGRSAYTFLTFGRDRAAALAEWQALRRSGSGTTRLEDNWGAREYQYILQDLGFYSGAIDGDHGPQTDEAVELYRESKGLPPGTAVDDAVWAAMIEDYLAQDNLSVPENQFLPNCEGEILKWLGCGEKDPVRNTQDAWRPNRHTELLFINAAALPCEVPEPVTFNLPAPGAVGSSWCLGPGDPNKRCCFLTRQAEQPGKWLVQPAEPGTVNVQGSIMFEDGTPAANLPYVLIAPDGEYMDGERPSGENRGRPIPGRTAADGTFSYPSKPKGVGVYVLEVQGAFVARLEGDPPEAARGPVVCQRLEGASPFNVILSREGCRLQARVHFEFDKSFVRPAAKRALRALADFVQGSPASLRVLPVGHTDLRGRGDYNVQLGLRRAKAVYGFLTGNPPDPDNPARTIWLNLFHDPQENWGAREIQYMLQDLGFYCHHPTGAMDPETNRAVRSYKRRAGLGDNDIVDDAFLDRLFADYIAHEGAAVPANRFLDPPRWLTCGEDHPIDLRGGRPFDGPSEKNRRVEFFTFSRNPNPAPASPTDCSRYLIWNAPCDRLWLDFIGPKRIPDDPADAEEVLAFLEIANWQNAFDFDPPDPGTGHRRPTGNAPRADFIDRDPDRFFVQITDLDRLGAGTIRARIRTLDEGGAEVNPPVEFELTENPNDPGTFRSNSMLLVADEIDNGEINNGSAAGATPFRARGIANGALNDPLHRAALGGQVVIEYNGSELGRIPVFDRECIRTVNVDIAILRLTDGTAVTTEADVQERVRRLQQNYMQAGLRFNVSIRTVALADMPAGVILDAVSGIRVNPAADRRAALDAEERALLESTLNLRSVQPGGSARTDVIQIFYANHLDGAAATAIAYPIVSLVPDPGPTDDIENCIIIGANDPEENSTLPHEMMHNLLDDFHNASSVFRTNVFFEAAVGERNFTDTTVTSNKRIPEDQVERIHNNVSRVIPDGPP